MSRLSNAGTSSAPDQLHSALNNREKHMTTIQIGDRVRVTTTRYGTEQHNTTGKVVSINRHNGVITVDFDGSPKVAPTRFNQYSRSDLMKVFGPGAFEKIAPEPSPRQLFMVSLLDMRTSELHPNKKPRLHPTREAAEKEAARLAKKYGGTFIVLQFVSGAHRPVPVTPPVTTFQF